MSRVYFIKPVGLRGPIKIGCSCSPDGRRKTLDSWSPFALEIVAEIPGDFELERRFHAAFLSTHDRREWFGWSVDLQGTIDAINAGAFDVSTLPEPVRLTGRRVEQSVKWSPLRRMKSSLERKVRAASASSGYVLPRGVFVSQIGTAGFEHVQGLVESFIADPITHGISRAQLAAETNQAQADYHRDAARMHAERAARYAPSEGERAA